MRVSSRLAPPPGHSETSSRIRLTQCETGVELLTDSMKKDRRSNRVRAVLPVRVSGTDAAGKPYTDVVHTLDITDVGARLGAIRSQLKIGSQLILQFRQHRAEFRVVWTQLRACHKEHQVGLEALAGRDLWGLAELKPEQESSTQPASNPAWATHLPTLAKMLRRTAMVSAKQDRERESHSSITGFRSVPTPSTVTSITSPAKTGPTPSGVPVAMTSPGSKVIKSVM